ICYISETDKPILIILRTNMSKIYMSGVNWTKHFFAQSLFALKELSDVFSQLQWQRSKDQFEQPFNETFRKRYKYFKEKLTLGNYNCCSEDKQDLSPLLTAALSISIFLPQHERLSKIRTTKFLQNLNFKISAVEQAFVNKLLSTDSQTIFHSSNFKDATDEIIARLYNPFKVLLTNPNKFEKERKPGEQPENKTQETEFVIRYCSNGHPFFVKKYQGYCKEIKCPDPWCNTLIDK
ncbi:hypothetical protein RFI_39886, partial [Reticulomyxa filosa]